jgi:hypothetical protein
MGEGELWNSLFCRVEMAVQENTLYPRVEKV